MTDYDSIASGDFNDPTKWDVGGTYPGTTDRYWIKDTHVMRIDSGTGNQTSRYGTIESGGELVITSEDIQIVKMIIDNHASAGFDLQTGGLLTLLGTASYRAKLEFTGGANRHEIKFNGELDFDYGDIVDVYPTNSYIDVAGLTADLNDVLVNGYGTIPNLYYLKGKITSFAHRKTELRDVYYSIQNANYDFVFYESPRYPRPDKPTISSDTPILGRDASRVKMGGLMAETVVLNGRFTKEAYKWYTEDLEVMRNSLESFTFVSPKKIIPSVVIEDVVPLRLDGSPSNYPYSVVLKEDK